MIAIVSVFWRICLFKIGPDVIPANNFLLGLLIALNAIVSWSASMLLQALLPISPEITNQIDERELAAMTDGFLLFSRVFVSLASTAALTWGVLAMMGKGARLYKVLCAMFGADLILTVLTTLAVAIGQLLHPMLGQFAILAMFIWTVAVIGFILHRALEISLGLGVAAGLFVMTFSFAISQVALSQ